PMTSEVSEESGSTQEAASTPAPLWARAVATFFGAGRIQPAPGSWGSLCAILVWLIAADMTPPRWQPEVLGALILVAVVLGIPAATRVSRSAGIEDPSFVVIDEVAGQWITLLF